MHPIYIISKGRPDQCLTARALDRMGVSYKVVVEPPEFEAYAKELGAECLLTLPFQDLGLGSIPARNWVWEHSIEEGHDWHWILDDNMEAFNRLHKNKKFEVRSGAIFTAAEDFVDRYENIDIAGMNYYSFCKATDEVPPFYVNTRVYSCLLIRNALELRWRGRYNEDTDLCLRVLKSGRCTVLFNAFLCGKVTSMRMGGGNTDHVYADTDNRKEFAESLARQHPDIVKVVWRFNRWHHHVDYRQFKKTKLIRKPDVILPEEPNNYGMYLGEGKRIGEINRENAKKEKL